MSNKATHPSRSPVDRPTGRTPDDSSQDQESGDLAALIERIPEGWSLATYEDRRYGLTRTSRVDGQSISVFAEELGGPDLISANVYRTCEEDHLREMPEAKVSSFESGSPHESRSLPTGWPQVSRSELCPCEDNGDPPMTGTAVTLALLASSRTAHRSQPNCRPPAHRFLCGPVGMTVGDRAFALAAVAVRPAVSTVAVLLGIAAGALAACGRLAFYTAMQNGPISLVAPVAASGVAVPVAGVCCSESR